MKKELSSAEQAEPYAKYFYQPIAPRSKEIMDTLGKGPIDPSLAIQIQHRDDLLKPGHLPAEIGYCLMPDGSGYVAMLIKKQIQAKNACLMKEELDISKS
jgi:hypothetical protein